MRTQQTIQDAKTASNRALALTESLPYGYFAGGGLSLENNKIKIAPLYASIHGKSVYKTSEYEIQASDWLCPQTSSFTYSVYIRDTGKVFVDRTEYIVNTMYIGKYHPVIPAIYLGSVAIDSAGAYEAVYSRDNLTYESFAGGIIASMNWSAYYGSQINLNDGSFKLGGSANPKLSWDGNNLLISGGSVGGINISSTEMYLGMGNYNNADTPFYVNNTGSFSLGDKFVWDGTNLTINATNVDWTVLSQTVDGDFTVKDGSNTHIIYKVDVTSGTSTGVFSANGNMTITKTTEQLRLKYDGSNYNTFTVGSTGSLTIAATGTNPNITLTPGGTGYTILNGNVGIGMINPDAVLHLVKDSPNDSQFIQFQSAKSSNPLSFMTFKSSRGTIASPTATKSGDWLGGFNCKGYGATGWSLYGRGAVFVGAQQDWTNSAQGTFLYFETTASNSTSQTEKMRITGEGNVGIGTTSPSGKLHVVGEIRAADSSNAGVAIYQSTSPTRGEVASYNWGSSAWQDLSLRASATVGQLYLKTDGNVGIGTTSPAMKLQISSQGGLDYASTSEICLRYNNYYSGGDKWIKATGKGMVLILSDTGMRYLASNDSSSGAGNTITNWGEKFTINPNGNVGIGVAPDSSCSLKTIGHINVGGAIYTLATSTSSTSYSDWFTISGYEVWLVSAIGVTSGGGGAISSALYTRIGTTAYGTWMSTDPGGDRMFDTSGTTLRVKSLNASYVAYFTAIRLR